MRRFIVQREISEIGNAVNEELKSIARGFNEILGKLEKEMQSNVQWVETYVTGDKTYCVFLAPSKEVLQQYTQKSGFPADSITEIYTVIDPATAHT
ncbi:MAG: DUF4242 domain-containing protein [Planctomycetota bacterium]|jgi:hypothetical protein